MKKCEHSVRELASLATAEGVYEIALQLVALAQDISRIADRFEVYLANETTQAENGVASVEGNEIRTAMHSGAKIEQIAKRQETPGRVRSKSTKKKAYPKFFRQKNDLVKVGWSKSRGGEYWHKAPKKVVDLLVKGLQDNAANEDLFTANDIFPVLAPGSMEIPGYQLYLCLAWLRQEGFVTQVGRQGYRLIKNEQLVESVENKWRHLPSRDF